MKAQSADTHPDAEKVLISLFRQASTAKKFYHVRSLSQTTIRLSRRAIARTNKHLNEKQINLLFIAHHYGKDLAENVKKYLDNMQHASS
ncbi:MAG: hypothetical protein ABIK98_01825 [Pseudomonadota bacterium]